MKLLSLLVLLFGAIDAATYTKVTIGTLNGVQFGMIKTTSQEAKALCVRLGGKLADLTTAEKNYIVSRLRNYNWSNALINSIDLNANGGKCIRLSKDGSIVLSNTVCSGAWPICEFGEGTVSTVPIGGGSSSSSSSSTSSFSFSSSSSSSSSTTSSSSSSSSSSSTKTSSSSSSSSSTSSTSTSTSSSTPNFKIPDWYDTVENPWYDSRGVFSSCPIKGSLCLTFDDGPSKYTNRLLDILKANNVKATFFVIGMNLRDSGYASAIKRAYQEGHLIASHTWSHPHLIDLSRTDIISEMTQTANEIKKVIGFKPTYMRPPYGEYNESVIQTLTGMGYKMILWNIDTNDWQYWQNSPYEIYRTFLDGFAGVSQVAKKSWISLQHDLYSPSVEYVPSIIALAKSKGYKFYKVNECFSDQNPYTN